MNAGVEILLQRMKDNPEDFYYHPNKGMSRWHRLVDHAIADEVVTQEEKDALDAGMKEVRRQSFTELVMKELAGEGEPSDEKKSPYLAPSATLSVGATLGQSIQATWGNTNSAFLDAQRYQTEQLRIQVDAQIKAMKQQESKKRWWNRTMPDLLGKK